MAFTLGAFFATPNPGGWDELIVTDSQTHFRLVVEVLLKYHASVHETLSSPPLVELPPAEPPFGVLCP